jgi:uncharacterized protein YcfJ
VNHNLQVILGLTALASLGVGLVGAVVLQSIRRRSLQWSIIVAALVPVAAVTASIWLNVTTMVLSERDSWVVTVALVFASVLGVAVSYVLGRRVASGAGRRAPGTGHGRLQPGRAERRHQLAQQPLVVGTGRDHPSRRGARGHPGEPSPFP